MLETQIYIDSNCREEFSEFLDGLHIQYSNAYLGENTLFFLQLEVGQQEMIYKTRNKLETYSNEYRQSRSWLWRILN